VKCCALNSDDGPHFSILGESSFEVVPGDRSKNYWHAADLISELQGYSAVLAGAEPYTREVLESLPALRIIARTGVGFDAIDLAACNDHGVVVTTTPGVNHIAVAEHTIAMLMAISRNFPEQDQRVRSGNWLRVASPRIMSTTIGLVGLGRIGQAVATRAVGLGMNVIAYEPYPEMDFVENWGVELLEFEEVLRISDYLSMHNPLSDETRHMMNAASFAKMKKGSVFINTARGGLVREADLIDSLNNNHLRGAALDVFEVEPLPLESPLASMPNVILSGHVAGLDIESHHDTLTMAAETILALKCGDWPSHCIQNLAGVYDWTWDRP